VTLWPAADEYCATRDRRAQLWEDLSDAQQQTSLLDSLEAKAEQRRQILESFEKKAVPQDQLYGFRNRLVEMTRESGCRVRRIQLGSPRTRRWYENDNPCKQIKAPERGQETPFQLQTQPVALSAAGSLPQIKRLLAELHETGKMMHTKSFRLRPDGSNRKAVVLELELILYDLQKTEAKAA